MGVCGLLAVDSIEYGQECLSSGFPIKKYKCEKKNFLHGSWNYKETLPKDNGMAPYNCRRWFDGCNSCTRDGPGGDFACTRVGCPDGDRGEKECLDFYSRRRAEDLGTRLTAAISN